MLGKKQNNQGLLRGVKQALEWVIGLHRPYATFNRSSTE